jgi:hypothetical protein
LAPYCSPSKTPPPPRHGVVCLNRNWRGPDPWEDYMRRRDFIKSWPWCPPLWPVDTSGGRIKSCGPRGTRTARGRNVFFRGLFRPIKKGAAISPSTYTRRQVGGGRHIGPDVGQGGVGVKEWRDGRPAAARRRMKPRPQRRWRVTPTAPPRATSTRARSDATLHRRPLRQKGSRI